MTQSRKLPVILWLFLSSLLWQINRAPSFGTDQKIDYDVKKGVLLNALKLLNIRYSHALTRILASRGLTYTESQSLYQNLVLRRSINISNIRSHMHCQCSCLGLLWLSVDVMQRHIAADLKVNSMVLSQMNWRSLSESSRGLSSGAKQYYVDDEVKERFVPPLLLL